MSSHENAKRNRDAIELMLGRGAEAFLPLHERRAAMNRERARQSRVPLVRWFLSRRAQAAERWAERCREQIAKAEQVKARRTG
jgi:hypothetical protein